MVEQEGASQGVTYGLMVVTTPRYSFLMRCKWKSLYNLQNKWCHCMCYTNKYIYILNQFNFWEKYICGRCVSKRFICIQQPHSKFIIIFFPYIYIIFTCSSLFVVHISRKKKKENNNNNNNEKENKLKGSLEWSNFEIGKIYWE